MSFQSKKLLAPILALVAIVLLVVVIMAINDKNTPTNPNSLTAENANNNEPESKNNKMNKIYLKIGEEKLEIKLEDNSTVSALVKMLPLTLSMDDLNNNEKYVYLDSSLPTNTYSPKRIEAGDVMLFGDNCLVVFYESFNTSYTYSKIGHIDHLPKLGDGSVAINLTAD